MRVRSLVVPLLAVVLSAAAPRDVLVTTEPLARRLAGHYSSEAQSLGDPDYVDVRLHILPMWRGRTADPWLYVARSVPGRPEEPYRQTVYRVQYDAFTRRVDLVAYAIKDPARFASASADRDKLDAMTESDLAPQPGCTIALVPVSDGDFTGGTRGRDCPGDAGGVAYVTSEWTVGKETLQVWDRAYDANGRQVWGASRGPYVFRRVVASSFP